MSFEHMMQKKDFGPEIEMLETRLIVLKDSLKDMEKTLTPLRAFFTDSEDPRADIQRAIEDTEGILAKIRKENPRFNN